MARTAQKQKYHTDESWWAHAPLASDVSLTSAPAPPVQAASENAKGDTAVEVSAVTQMRMHRRNRKLWTAALTTRSLGQRAQLEEEGSTEAISTTHARGHVTLAATSIQSQQANGKNRIRLRLAEKEDVPCARFFDGTVGYG